MRNKDRAAGLYPLVWATLAQLGVFRLAEWAQGAQYRDETARQLVDGPYLVVARLALTFLILWLLWRLVRDVLDLRGMRLGEWLRSSALWLVGAALLTVLTNLDHVLALLGGIVPALSPAARAVSGGSLYLFLQGHETLRGFVSLVSIALVVLAARAGVPKRPDVVAASEAEKLGDPLRAGELSLKAGDLARAKKMFLRAKAWPRLAALEMREGGDQRLAAE